jgi:2',3'-cyclic-nucleotide 2'-phosphodiesterase (5'-nucleotidase family)
MQRRLHLFCGLAILLIASSAFAQVRIVQWSDAHSALATLPQQLKAMDLLAKSFYAQHPQGEFIVYVIGDFTSISPYSQVDKGQLSFDALRLLKERGYTVLFTPGNHDALDWGLNFGGELLFQQMQQLYEWGIPVLAANLTKVRRPFRDFLLPYYELKTLSVKSALMGMTLETFFLKSNLTPENARPLFEDVEPYEESLKRHLPEVKEKGFRQLFLGVHEGHERLSQLTKKFSALKMSFPLVMGADDHVVAAYKRNGSLITDAGSHGSFNVIDIDREAAQVRTPVLHVAISEESFSRIEQKLFLEGEATLNAITAKDLSTDLEFKGFKDKVDSFISQVDRRLYRVLGWTQGFSSHKYHMKRGRTDLGSLLSEAHVLWARSLMNSWTEPVIAMVNSSSYRREEPLLPGSLREIDLRGMYPFENKSAVFRLLGKDIESLFFARRQEYERKEKGAYSPQLNFAVREKKKKLEVLISGEWLRLKKHTSYLVVIDGYLVAQFKNKTWQEILSQNPPLAARSFQDLLVDFLPTAIYKFENPRGALSCWEIF